ncbi:attf-4, partial [Pristionchus pacificus]
SFSMEDDDCSASQHSDNPEHHEMDHLDDQTMGIKREDEARSSESATSSRDEEEGKEGLNERLRDLHNSVTFLSHQMAIIMKALHVNSCQCELCGSRGQNNGHHNGVSPNLGIDYAQRPGGGKFPMVDRRAVSDYALQHGGMAAVRRFGVPAPVSSYYQRKESHGKLPGNNSPGPSTDGERNGEEQSSSSGTPSGLPPSVDAMLKMTSSTMMTGTPGFLRGRGRGRPKLIGDELDADLVEYMVQLQKTDHSLHRMSATQALEIARAYILDKAPGLLEEQGGHVKLKLTWAMKLVSRIAERQKEIELGLPPGTLQNMGRSQQLAEMVAISKFGGFGGRMNGGGEGGMGAALEALQHQVASSTPEIMNVRELDLSRISSGIPLDASDLDGSAIHSSGELPLIGANGEILFPNEDHDV